MLQNVKLQNVESQNAEFQNIELQNAELQKRRITEHWILQNVKSYKTLKYKTLNLTERQNTKSRKWQAWMVNIFWNYMHMHILYDVHSSFHDYNLIIILTLIFWNYLFLSTYIVTN